jgi:hypothetical protein
MKIQHLPCPQCRKLGKDRSGDNLAVYPDGGSFCFSCGYHESSKKYVPKLREDCRIVSFPRSPIPSDKRKQLELYLTDKEIQDHFTFDPNLGRMVLLDTLPDFYWGRDGHNGRSKVFTQGKVPFHVFSSKLGLRSSTLIVVEDPISAIAVSRVCDCLPLFGSHLSSEWYHKLLVAGYDDIVFWLDRDKAQDSLSYALSFRHLFNTDYILSPKDPKCYSVAEIQQYIEKAYQHNDPLPI